MINIFTVISILCVHWIADFILQTDYMAKNKSTDIKALLLHVFVYSSCFFIFPLTSDNHKLYLLPLITFVCHFLTDFITSKVNKSLIGNNHYFFVAIGFDQLLHFIQLLVTYDYLINQ